MSYWVYLKDDEGLVDVPRHQEGGTVQVAGSTQAELNVTYNYAEYYYEHLDEEDGLRALDGEKADDWIEALEDAVDELGTETTEDYWESTPGNAGRALQILLNWARRYPEAHFEVS